MDELSRLRLEQIVMRAHHPNDEKLVLFSAYLDDEIDKNEFTYGLRYYCGLKTDEIAELLKRFSFIIEAE